MQPLCLQWKGWIVLRTADQQKRGLRAKSGDLIRADDKVKPPLSFVLNTSPAYVIEQEGSSPRPPYASDALFAHGRTVRTR